MHCDLTIRGATPEQAEGAVSPNDRERIGRVVREIWIDWAREQPSPKPTWLLPWEDLTDTYREAGCRIGEQLFSMGLMAGRAVGEEEVEALRKRVAELEFTRDELTGIQQGDSVVDAAAKAESVALPKQLSEARAEATTLREDVERWRKTNGDIGAALGVKPGEAVRDAATRVIAERDRIQRDWEQQGAMLHEIEARVAELDATCDRVWDALGAIRTGEDLADAVARRLEEASADAAPDAVSPLRPAEDIAREMVGCAVERFGGDWGFTVWTKGTDGRDVDLVVDGYVREESANRDSNSLRKTIVDIIERSRAEGKRAPVEAPRVAAVVGPHICRAHDREVFVGDRDGLKGCDETSPRFWHCTIHLNGEHVALAGNEVCARWPIAPAQDEPQAASEGRVTGSYCEVEMSWPRGAQPDLLALDAAWLVGAPGARQPGYIQSLYSHPAGLRLAMPKDADPRAVLATVAELLGLQDQQDEARALSDLRRAHHAERDDEPANIDDRWQHRRERLSRDTHGSASAFERAYLHGMRDAYTVAGVEMRRARGQAERELGNPAVLKHWSDRTPDEIERWAEEAEGDNPRHASWCRGVAAGIREGERRAGEAWQRATEAGSPAGAAGAMAGFRARNRAWQDATGVEQPEYVQAAKASLVERAITQLEVGIAEGERRAEEKARLDVERAVAAEAARGDAARLEVHEKYLATARELVTDWEERRTNNIAGRDDTNLSRFTRDRLGAKADARETCINDLRAAFNLSDNKPPTGGEPAPVDNGPAHGPGCDVRADRTQCAFDCPKRRADMAKRSEAVADRATTHVEPAQQSTDERPGLAAGQTWRDVSGAEYLIQEREERTPCSTLFAVSAGGGLVPMYRADAPSGWTIVSDAPAAERWRPGAVWERIGERVTVRDSSDDEIVFCEHGWCTDRHLMTERNGWRYVGPGAASGGNGMEADGAQIEAPLGAQPETPNVPTSCQVIPSGAESSTGAGCSGPAPVVPGKPSAEERAAVQQQVDIGAGVTSTAPSGMTLGGVWEALKRVARVDREEAMSIERAHADGIVEGLRRARDIARRMSDADRLQAVDVHEMHERLDAAVREAAANVAPADLPHVDRSALLGLATGWERADTRLSAKAADARRDEATRRVYEGEARGFAVAALELRRLLDAPSGPGGERATCRVGHGVDDACAECAPRRAGGWR
jgi:hypothetical protein